MLFYNLGPKFLLSKIVSFSVYQLSSLLARDAFVGTNHRAIAMMFGCLSVCLSGTTVHCDHTVHVSADISLWLIVQCSEHPDTKARPHTPGRFFQLHLK